MSDLPPLFSATPEGAPVLADEDIRCRGCGRKIGISAVTFQVRAYCDETCKIQYPIGGNDLRDSLIAAIVATRPEVSSVRLGEIFEVKRQRIGQIISEQGYLK